MGAPDIYNQERSLVTAEDVKRMRTVLGLSIVKFAKILGVSAVGVHKWEKGKTSPNGLQLMVFELLDAALKHNQASNILFELKWAESNSRKTAYTLMGLPGVQKEISNIVLREFIGPAGRTSTWKVTVED